MWVYTNKPTWELNRYRRTGRTGPDRTPFKSFNTLDKDNHWQLRVFRQNMVGRQEQIVKLPKNAVNGLYFEQCTCGANKTDAVSCEHMAAIVLSAVIRPQITPMNVMPIWWKRNQWREQFP
jgi:hypothetical protein